MMAFLTVLSCRSLAIMPATKNKNMSLPSFNADPILFLKSLLHGQNPNQSEIFASWT
jgi:hypothetical protein